VFRWTKSGSADLPEDHSVDRVALLLRLLIASAVIVFLFGIPMSDLAATALDDAGVQIPCVSNLALIVMMLVALWGSVLVVFTLFALRKRRKPRQQGFDVLPPSKK
jgi:heme/copper-type cytochrome/quinol oxidase subunit 2